MDIKMIKSDIQIIEGIFEIRILQSDWCCAYMLLDMLAENTLGEICFCDAVSREGISVKRSVNGKNVVDHGCIFLTRDTLDCIKRHIAQCYLNPYDASWLHCDIEISTLQGEEMALCVRF